MASGEAKLPGSTAVSWACSQSRNRPFPFRTLCRRRCSTHPPGSRTGLVPSQGPPHFLADFHHFGAALGAGAVFRPVLHHFHRGPLRDNLLHTAGARLRVWALTWVSFFPTPAHQASASLYTRPNCSNTSWSSCSLDGPYCFFRFRRSCSSSHWFFKRAAVSSSSLVLNFACSASYSALEMGYHFLAFFGEFSCLFHEKSITIKPAKKPVFSRVSAIFPCSKPCSIPAIGLCALGWSICSPSISQRYCCAVSFRTSSPFPRPLETPALQPFVQQHKAVAFPVQRFDPVFPPPRRTGTAYW